MAKYHGWNSEEEYNEAWETVREIIEPVKVENRTGTPIELKNVERLSDDGECGVIRIIINNCFITLTEGEEPCVEVNTWNGKLDCSMVDIIVALWQAQEKKWFNGIYDPSYEEEA